MAVCVEYHRGSAKSDSLMEICVVRCPGNIAFTVTCCHTWWQKK